MASTVQVAGHTDRNVPVYPASQYPYHWLGVGSAYPYPIVPQYPFYPAQEDVLAYLPYILG